MARRMRREDTTGQGEAMNAILELQRSGTLSSFADELSQAGEENSCSSGEEKEKKENREEEVEEDTHGEQANRTEAAPKVDDGRADSGGSEEEALSPDTARPKEVPAPYLHEVARAEARRRTLDAAAAAVSDDFDNHLQEEAKRRALVAIAAAESSSMATPLVSSSQQTASKAKTPWLSICSEEALWEAAEENRRSLQVKPAQMQGLELEDAEETPESPFAAFQIEEPELAEHMNVSNKLCGFACACWYIYVFSRRQALRDS